jgi:hypothetical protein
MPINNHNKTENQKTKTPNQIPNLQSMEKRVKKLTTRLWAGIFALLFIIAISGFFLFANMNFTMIVKALSPNYGKTSGQTLTANEWNTLEDDFVAKSGDTMTGNLTVNGQITGNQINSNGSLNISGDLNAPNLVRSGCYWSGWGCGVMTCNEGYFIAGIDFNAVRSEGCWGVGDDYDEPTRRLYCCKL